MQPYLLQPHLQHSTAHWCRTARAQLVHQHLPCRTVPSVSRPCTVLQAQPNSNSDRAAGDTAGDAQPTHPKVSKRKPKATPPKDHAAATPAAAAASDSQAAMHNQLPVESVQAVTNGSNGTPATQSKAPEPKRKWTRRMDPAEASALYKEVNNRLLEYEGEMMTRGQKSARVRTKTLTVFEGRVMTVQTMTGIKMGRLIGRSSGPQKALPPGSHHARGEVKVTLPADIWGKRCKVYIGYNYSQDGGIESLFCHRMDAALLAAHELGGRQAKDSPPGVHVVTGAGKEYLKTLAPFQVSPLADGQDVASARKVIKKDIRARTDDIYEQLLRWPHIPFEQQQGGD